MGVRAAVRIRTRTLIPLRMCMRLWMRVRVVYIAHVWITCLSGAVLWGTCCKILHQPARLLCLGQAFYGRGIRVSIRMPMCLRMRAFVNAGAVCILHVHDSLPFW